MKKYFSTWKKIDQLEKNRLHVNSLRENYKDFIKNNKLILKSQQRFGSERHNVFTEEVNKTALSAENDKRIHSIDSLETCIYGTTEKMMHKKKKNLSTSI